MRPAIESGTTAALTRRPTNVWPVLKVVHTARRYRIIEIRSGDHASGSQHDRTFLDDQMSSRRACPMLSAASSITWSAR
jgi:hypothetical protein